jgi:uncharacterized coiled-coil DUF342 family protein
VELFLGRLLKATGGDTMTEDEKVIEHLRSCDKHPERASIYTFDNAIECIKQLRKERDDAQVDQQLIEELWERRTEMTEMKEQIKLLCKERDEANSLVRRILSEINCRIEHGADSNGHLEGLHGLYEKKTP